MASMNGGLSAVAAAALLLAVGGTVGCGKSESVSCSTGIYCPAGTQCAAKQAVCILDDCGNGVVDWDEGEVCDDGGIADGDDLDGDEIVGNNRCSADCTSTEQCGNDILDEAVDEVCDDGNTVDGDGCSADCHSTEGCGNGVVDTNEECDGGLGERPGVALATKLCNTNCTWSQCKDGIVNDAADEDCDRNGDGVPGSSGQSVTCNVNCTISECGDEFINAAADEQCDRGPLGNSDTGDCLAVNCHLNYCGDGFPNLNGRMKEECDAGDANSDTGACLTTCRIATCGDGHVQEGVETCDTGADSATEKKGCDYGQQLCTLCSVCQWVNLEGPYCGDGEPHPKETCDLGADRNGATSCDYSPTSPTCDACSSDCLRASKLPAPHCGDGEKQVQEACDDENPVDEENRDAHPCPYQQATCTRCSADCSEILTGYTGPYCGDEIPQLEHDEACDKGTKNGATSCDYSTSITCDTCNSDCSKATTRTAPHCGDRIVQADKFEVCDDGNNHDEVSSGPGAYHCPYGQATCTTCSADCRAILDRNFSGPYCGDFTVTVTETVTEACDFRRSFGCGTCSTYDCQDVDIRQASGTLTVVDSNALLGVEFTLSNGIGADATFRFVDSLEPGTPDGIREVSITGDTAGTTAAADTVASRTETAITGAELGIRASRLGDIGNVVDLVNTVAGVSGNVPVAKSATDALTVTGMVGGVGCSVGQWCRRDRDCVSNNCDHGFCAVKAQP